MLRLAVLMWALVGTTLAGIFVLVIVTVPSLYDQGMRLIPYAVGAGFLLGVPIAVLIARRIVGSAMQPTDQPS